MQSNRTELREIIWEVTGACYNGCEYCGSKEGWKEVIDEGKIVRIAKEIVKYPPKVIDISGGDPLLIPLGIHKTIIDILREKRVICKILVNPKTVCKDIKKILSLYDWVGLSINNSEELKISKETFPVMKNLTVISNFNLKNFFDYAEIEKYVKEKNVAWQIQFTMYSDSNSNAIYNNDNATKELFSKIQDSIMQGIKVVTADNMNGALCGAGTSSLGILSNGNVVPCLSMRSWKKVEEVVQDNILTEKLEMIWKNKFVNYRFNDFICCKDICNNKCFVLTKKLDMDTPKENNIIKIKKRQDNQIMMYGVDSESTMVYGIFTNPVMAYAVTSDLTNSSDATWTNELKFKQQTEEEKDK